MIQAMQCVNYHLAAMLPQFLESENTKFFQDWLVLEIFLILRKKKFPYIKEKFVDPADSQESLSLVSSAGYCWREGVGLDGTNERVKRNVQLRL